LPTESSNYDMVENEKHVTKGSKPKRRWRRVFLGIGIFLVLALIGLRIALPYILLRVVNEKLQEIPNYEGHVDDIDVWLIRGAYTIKGIQLNKVGGKIPVPFFSTKVLDISIEWRALFHGAVVAKIRFDKPVLNFVKGPTEATSQTKIDKSWVDVVNSLIPLKLNRVEMDSGEIHYIDYYSEPKVNVFAGDIYALATNLSNSYRSNDSLPSSIYANANIYGGKMVLNMMLNPLNETPVFDMTAELKSLNIKNFNELLLAYGKFDVAQGSISIYTEAASKDNKILGYVKPIVKDLKVVDLEKDAKKPLHLAWEELIGLTAWVFKNHPHDQLATKIDFEGNLKDPKMDIWSIIGETLRNAFVQAISASIDHTININKVDTVAAKKDDPPKKEGFFHKIFHKKNSDTH
jgi:hypothetical protein